ncbi:hypothetical protein MVEN_01592600 [Mycena venus]|uniref:RRM domain-containing protein n=1 Tax=Mycena venus TaxID=2733690 RepID=A0A8H6XSX1_9AGAR|nr:hypothetical protein MVEN_01592600 [Mycena venus]
MARTIQKSSKKGLRPKPLARSPPKQDVFRAPSPSSTPSLPDSVLAMAGPSKPKATPPIRADQVTFAQLSKMRKIANREDTRAGLLVAAATAKKKQVKVQALQAPPFPPPVPVVAEPWVYVGNLDPEATLEDLSGHFSVCGGVQYVNIRYSNSGVPGRPQLGYRYAIVKFDAREAADAAIVNLNKSSLMGSEYKLVVEAELLNLPELQKLPEFIEVQRKEPLLVSGLPEPRTILVPVGNGNKFLTASGMTVTSPITRTRVWKPNPDTVRKKRKVKGKSVVVGGVPFTMTLA